MYFACPAHTLIFPNYVLLQCFCVIAKTVKMKNAQECGKET